MNTCPRGELFAITPKEYRQCRHLLISWLVLTLACYPRVLACSADVLLGIGVGRRILAGTVISGTSVLDGQASMSRADPGRLGTADRAGAAGSRWLQSWELLPSGYEKDLVLAGVAM